MDSSSLPQSHSQEQQNQFQAYDSQQAYYPTQIQPSTYDESHHSYYQIPQYSQQQHFTSYNSEYSSAYKQNYTQQPIHPPGVKVPPREGAAESIHVEVVAADSSAQVQNPHNAYYPPQQMDAQAELNPAATAALAALAQLTQWGLVAGTSSGPSSVDYAPRPMSHPSLYRGGGRRPFRGRRGRGNLSMRGKARNWGMGGPTPIQSHESSSSHPESSAEAACSTEENAKHTADNNNNNKEAEGGLLAQTTERAQGNAALNQRPNQFAWCEVCRVQCTSLEILVQHNNGKRHKKNLQRLEESENANISGAEILDKHTPIGVFSPEVTLKSHYLVEGEEKENKKILSSNLPTEAFSGGSRVKSEQKNDQTHHPDIPIEQQPNMLENNPELNRAFNQSHVWKCNMQGGHGRKRMKTSDTPRQPRKPKVVVIPLICDLCNVKCDTREVFDRHLSGKKHVSKLRRYEGHQAMYGEQGLQALYPPNPISQTLYARPGLQEALSALQQNIPPRLDMPSQVHHATTTAVDTRLQQNPNIPMSSATSDLI